MTAGRARGGRERGAGSVLVVGLAAVLVVVSVTVVLVAAAVLARHRAAAAADLAALAGADALVTAQDPCAAARRVATANGARLIACSTDGVVVDCTASVRATGLLGSVVGSVARSARAGPEDDFSSLSNPDAAALLLDRP